LGFHITPTTEQPKGRCVCALGLRSWAPGTSFAEKTARRNVAPEHWVFLAGMGGGLQADSLVLQARHMVSAHDVDVAQAQKEDFFLWMAPGKVDPPVCQIMAIVNLVTLTSARRLGSSGAPKHFRGVLEDSVAG